MYNLAHLPIVRYLKRGAIILAGLLLILIIYLVIPKSYISFTIAPQEMFVSIDNGKPETLKNGQTRLVAAGKHAYTFSREGFATETISVTAGNNETKKVLYVLTAKTDAARAILKGEGDKSLMIQEQYASRQEAAFTATIAKNYPILKNLPIVLHSMTIAACQSQKYPNDPTKIALCVTNDDGDKARMLLGPVLKNKGYDASKYEIIYKDPYVRQATPYINDPTTSLN